MKNSLLTEIGHLEEISTVSSALVDFALAIEPECRVEKEDERYVLTPKNFVTFSVHYKRANNLTVTLRGNPDEFERQAELGITKDQNGYSLFKLKDTAQLAAAAVYIRRAHELYDRGRSRSYRTPQTIEK